MRHEGTGHLGTRYTHFMRGSTKSDGFVRRARVGAPIALLTLTLAVWVTSVVCIIDRGGQGFDAILVDGALRVDWAGAAAVRRHWHDVRSVYDSDNLRHPGNVGFHSFSGPGSSPPPTSWYLELAPVSAMSSKGFWTSQRLGFRRPNWWDELFGYKSFEFPLLWLTASPVVWLAIRIARRRRIRPGCCLRCGYDLTGNTSGVCSECGLAKKG